MPYRNAVIAFSSLAIEEGDLTPKDQEYIDSSLVSAQALLGAAGSAFTRPSHKHPVPTEIPWQRCPTRIHP